MDIIKLSTELQELINQVSKIESGKKSLKEVLEFLQKEELSSEVKSLAIKSLSDILPTLVPAFEELKVYLENLNK